MGSSLCSFEAPSIVYQRPAHCVGKPRSQSQQQQQQQQQQQAVAQRRPSRPPHLQLPSPANRRSHPQPSFGRAADSDSDWEAVLPLTTRPVGETHTDDEAALHQLVDSTTNRRGGSSSRRSHSNNNSTKSQESPFVTAQGAGNTSQLSPLVPLPHHGTPQHQLPVYLQSQSRSGGHQQLPTHYPPPLHPPQSTPNPFEGPHSARLAPSLGSFPNYSGASYHQHYHQQQLQQQQHHHPTTGTTTRSSLNDITATSSSGLARSIGGANNNSRGSSSGRQSAAYSTNNNHSNNNNSNHNNNSGRSLLSVPRLSNSGGGGSGSAAKLEGSGDHHPPSSSSTNTSLHASAQRMGSTDSGGGEGGGKKWWVGAPQHTTTTTTTQEGFDFEWSGSVALQEEYQRARRAAAGHSLPPPAPPPAAHGGTGGDAPRKRQTNREGEETELSTPSSLASRQPRSDMPVPPAPSSQGHNHHSHLPPQAPPLPPSQQQQHHQQQQGPSASGRGPSLQRLSSGGGGGSPATNALRLSFLEREATTGGGGSLQPPITPTTTPTTAANSVPEPSPGGGGGTVVSADDGSVGAFRPARRGSNRSLSGVPRPGSGGTQPDSSSATTPGGGGGLGALPGTGFSQGADSCSLGSGQRSTVSTTSQGGVKSHQQHHGFSSLDSGQGSPRGGQSAGAPSTPLSSLQPPQQRQHALPSTVSHSSMSRGNPPPPSATNNNKDSGGGGNGSTTSIVVPRPLTILGNGAVVPIGLPLMWPGVGGGGGMTSPTPPVVAVATGVATSAPPVSPFRDVLRSMGSSYDGGSSLHSSSRCSTGLGAGGIGGGPLLYVQQSPYRSLSNQPSLTDSSRGGGVVYHQRGVAQSGMDKLEEAELHSGSVAQSEHTRCFAAEDSPVFGCGGEGATTATVMHRVPSQPPALLLTPFSGVGSDPLSVHNYDVAEHTP